MPEPAGRLLRKLLVTRVDLVDSPANPGAQILLYKRARPVRKDQHPPVTFDEALLQRRMHEIWGRLMEGVDAIAITIQDALENAEVPDKADAIRQAIGAFAERMQVEIEAMLAPGGVAKVGRKVSEARLGRLKAAQDALGHIITEAEEERAMTKGTVQKAERPKDFDKLEEGVRGYITGLEAQVAELRATIEASNKGEGDVLKRLDRLDPEVAAIVQKAQREADEAKAIAKAEKDLRETGVWAQRITAVTKRLPVKADDLVPVFKAMTPEHAELVLKALRGADEQLAKAALLTTEIGRAGGDAGGDAWSKIEAGGAQLMQKSKDPLTKEQAVSAFLRTPEGKALYDEHKRERRERPTGA